MAKKYQRIQELLPQIKVLLKMTQKIYEQEAKQQYMTVDEVKRERYHKNC